MAKGDRIKITTGNTLGEENNFPVFDPIIDPSKPSHYMTDNNGYVIVKAVGGVKPGSLGRIDGDGVRVSSTVVYGKTRGANLGNDWEMIFPVFFDEYQQVAWVAQDHFRIITG